MNRGRENLINHSLAGTLTPFVNLPAMANVVEINPPDFRIELIKHTVITNAEFELRTASQSLVWKMFQPQTHFIYLALHNLPNALWQAVE